MFIHSDQEKKNLYQYVTETHFFLIGQYKLKVCTFWLLDETKMTKKYFLVITKKVAFEKISIQI